MVVYPVSLEISNRLVEMPEVVFAEPDMIIRGIFMGTVIPMALFASSLSWRSTVCAASRTFFLIALPLGLPAAQALVPVEINTVMVVYPDQQESSLLEADLILEAVEVPGSPESETRRIPSSVPGKVALSLPDESRWRVRLSKEGYWGEALDLVIGEASALSLHLFPTGEVHGRLPGGMAPGEVKADFRTAPSYRRTAGTAVSESSELCRVEEAGLRCRLPVGRLDLRLPFEGFAPLYFWGVDVTPGGVTELGPLELVRGSSVTGWVEDTEGRPLGDVEIELGPEAPGAAEDPVLSLRLRQLRHRTTTNDRGFFQVRGLASGVYGVAASKKGFAPGRTADPVWIGDSVEEVLTDTLVLAWPLSLELTLNPPLDPYGVPWAVRLREMNSRDDSVSASVSRSGRWITRDVTPGVYWLTIADSEGSHWVTQQFDLFADESLFYEIPVLEVRGTVTSEGDPVPGALWLTRPVGKGSHFRFEVDQEGEFEGFLSEPGEWHVRVISEQPEFEIHLDPIEVEPGSGKSVAILDIKLPNTRLEGEVVDSVGSPVSDAAIQVFHRGHKGLSEVKSDEEGQFEARGLAPGLIMVSASTRTAESDVVTIDLQEDLTPPHVRLTVYGTVELTGQVLTSSGKPVTGARILAWGDFGPSSSTAIHNEGSGLDGSFSFLVRSGTLWLNYLVAAPGFGTRILRRPMEASVPVFITVERNGGDLILDLPRSEDENPGQMPKVTLVHDDVVVPFGIVRMLAETYRRVTVDDRLVVRNVETGPYSLCAGSGFFVVRDGETEPDCASGFLAAGGELILTAPAAGALSTTRRQEHEE